MAFSALLGAFVFGLFGFEGNFGEYVRYLNSVGVDIVVNFNINSKENKKSDLDESLDLEILLEEGLDEEIVDSDDILDDAYFNPSAGDFGFAINMDEDDLEESTDSEQNTLANDQDLIDLIKSREK